MNRKVPSNYTAYVGESIVLNCPFHSVPDADYKWHFNNGTIVNFAEQNR